MQLEYEFTTTKPDGTTEEEAGTVHRVSAASASKTLMAYAGASGINVVLTITTMTEQEIRYSIEPMAGFTGEQVRAKARYTPGVDRPAFVGFKATVLLIVAEAVLGSSTVKLSDELLAQFNGEQD